MSTVSARERSEGDALTEQISRMNGEVQYIERIHFVRATDEHGVYIDTGVVVVLVTPEQGVAFTDLFGPALHVHMRSVLFHSHTQGVDAVATGRRGVGRGVQTGVGDGVTMPVQGLTRDDRRRVMTLEAVVLLQHVGHNRVATQTGMCRVHNRGGRGVGLTVQYVGVAERNNLRRTLNRVHGQYQLVDTVLTRTCLIINQIAAG